MQIHAGKISPRTGLLLLCISGAVIAGAQTPTAPGPAAPPPATDAGAKPGAAVPALPAAPGVTAAPLQTGRVNGSSASANGAPAPGAAPASSSTAALDYLFNHKPQDGSAAKQGADVGQRMNDKSKAADALGLGKQLDADTEARFETYLGAGEIPMRDLQAYATEIQRTIAFLRANNTSDAWKELRQLAAYQSIDAGVSGELANRIDAIWNTSRTSEGVTAFNKMLKRDVNTANRNADLMSKGIREEDIRLKRKENEGKKTAPAPAPANNGGAPAAAQAAVPPPDPTAATANTSHIEGKLELTQQYLTSLENQAKIKINELKAEKLVDKGKADFASYITTLYGSGRLQQVILASEFYRELYTQGDYPVAMGNQVDASLEKYRGVKNSIDVFRYKVDRNELVGATERLQDAFVACEFHPSVLSLERTLKEKVATYVANVSKIQNLIQARDFGALESVLNDTKRIASDFDSAKAMAMVNAVKLECKLRLGKAKLQAQQGDLKGAMDEFQAAAEAWPNNPELQDKALTFFDTQDVKTQSLVDFDRFFEEGNYRAIFDKQLMFAPAMKDDKKRQDQLKTALEAIKKAEIASEKASSLVLMGDNFGAWEAIEIASKDLPDDRKLNKLRADLSGRSAEFVSAINKARDAEERKDIGFGLTWYVNAQRQYPASRIANDGIERISKQLLGGDKPKTP